MPSNFRSNSLKTNHGHPHKVSHFFTGLRARNLARSARTLAIFPFLFSIFCLPVPAQTPNAPAKIPGDLASDLKEFVETPSVSGYENQLTEKIRAKLAAFHPVVDNLGDVIVTIGSGAPHRLIVTPIDEPGFVVSGITADGYLRLATPSAGRNLPPIFNALYSAQPVKVRTASGKWIDGVVAGISVHSIARMKRCRAPATSKTCTSTSAQPPPPKPAPPVSDNLSPVAINRDLNYLWEQENLWRVDRRQIRRRCTDRRPPPR